MTGVVVAFGATFILSAIVGGVLVALGISDTPSAVINAGVGAGIALIVAEFLSYLWGGYAAGRMARGAGLANGLLVPLAAILVAVAVGAIVTALGATANLNLPSISNFNPRLPISSKELNGRVLDTSLWMALGALIAMFVGGAIGGLLGARWHTKLERNTLEERDSDTPVGATTATSTGEVETERTAETDRTVWDSGTDGDRTETLDRPVESQRTIETERTRLPNDSTADTGAISASPSTPATTGGAAAASEYQDTSVDESSGYPRPNPTVTGTSDSTDSSVTGDTRA
jgi:hypothetical protein